MREVDRQIVKASGGLQPEAVHDLRVALRRCRSMAAGFRAIDPERNWKRMRRQATELFDSLGELRDVHVMLGWVEVLGPRDDPLTARLGAHLQQQEPALEAQASSVLKKFDRQQWQQWARLLPERAAHLPPGAEAFHALALEQLVSTRRLQSPALKTGGDAPFHRLRIEIKKFRYLVENFLPEHHENWKEGLKSIQDLLGEIHDLDVLRQVLITMTRQAPLDPDHAWLKILEQARNARVERYRESMSGTNSLWALWRSGLPRGPAARKASMQKLQAWSSFLETDMQHSRRVARFASRIYDGLARGSVLPDHSADDRELLQAASLVHEVGRGTGNKEHHKKTEKMITAMDRLVGWKRQEVMVMARVARYHRGALPRISQLRSIPRAEWNRVRLLAGILRLANALDDSHDGSIRSIQVKKQDGFLRISALGLRADSAKAERIAAARHLLEVSCGLPVLVQPLAKRRTRTTL
jgi:CHAD domain-containing protein